jgi:hypothetical protein
VGLFAWFFQQQTYKLKVMARDKGSPVTLNSTANVIIKVASGASNPPTWDENYDSKIYYVDETAVTKRIAVMKVGNCFFFIHLFFKIY